jgi:transcription-repair coupling factor (superfamily II helicase)
MEMYKKISLITSIEDERDIYDEFLDRYGELPRTVERLIEVALMRALAERCGISRIEERDGSLIFTVGKPNLAVWSEVFSGYLGMRFTPQGDKVVYKFRGGEPSSVGVKIMRDYYRSFVEQQ